MTEDFAARLRQLRDNNGWTTAEMSYRSGLPKRSLEKYMLRDKASLPGYEALLAMAKGFGVSMDWLVFGSDASSKTVEIIVDRCATEFSQQVFDVLMRELLAGRPLLKNGEILNLSVEEWASSIGSGAAQRAKELIRAGVTREELELWRASRGGILGEIITSRFERLKSGEWETNK